MISALPAVPDMLSPTPGLASGYPSNVISQRFQDMMQPTASADVAPADEPVGLEIDSQAQAIDTQVLSGLVGASDLNHADPESEDE
ncbi:hypothetical protein ACFX58_14580 [Sphingomonas sp. NCPPB 2930]